MQRKSALRRVLLLSSMIFAARQADRWCGNQISLASGMSASATLVFGEGPDKTKTCNNFASGDCFIVGEQETVVGRESGYSSRPSPVFRLLYGHTRTVTTLTDLPWLQSP